MSDQVYKQDHNERRHRHHHSHHHSEHSKQKRKRSPPPALPVTLPFKAQPLTKHELTSWTPVFASYLDIQKQIFLEDLAEDEIKGRWKSFISKWNRGQLAEGWYDPATKQRALESYSGASATADSHDVRAGVHDQGQSQGIQNSDSDADDYGPDLPSSRNASRAIARPSAPNFGELALRAEEAAEDEENRREHIRAERKASRLEQRERLEELVPRAEAGTKERQLEKKKEKAAAVQNFRDAKGGAGDIQEVTDSELMGEGGGTDDIKRMKKEFEKKRSEREERKLEILRARAVEREERLQAHKEKEDKTMEMLKAIAKERFG